MIVPHSNHQDAEMPYCSHGSQEEKKSHPYGVIQYAKHEDLAELAKDKKFKEDLARYIRRAEAGVQDSPVKDFLNMDLIFTINRALGRLREAVTLIVRLCEEGECDEQKLIESIKNLQESWETECEEVAIVDLKRGSYKVILHRDPDHIGEKPSKVWRYVGGTKDSQGIRNLLEEEMKTSSEGLKVVELLNWEGRQPLSLIRESRNHIG